MQSKKSMFKPVKNVVLWLILSEDSNCNTSGVLTSKAVIEINFGQCDVFSPIEMFAWKPIFFSFYFIFLRGR